jgi:ribosomal protein L18E
MPRQAVAVFTAIVFVVFSSSCMTWRNKEIRTSADYPAPNKGVISVVKISGEVVEFSRKDLARVVGGQVVGTTVRERDVEIEGPFPLIKRLSDGTVSEITDANGQVWSVRRILKEEPGRMTVRIAERTGPIVIPLSEIAKIKIKRSSPALTILTVLGLAVTVYFVGLGISLGNA